MSLALAAGWGWGRASTTGCTIKRGAPGRVDGGGCDACERGDGRTGAYARSAPWPRNEAGRRMAPRGNDSEVRGREELGGGVDPGVRDGCLPSVLDTSNDAPEDGVWGVSLSSSLLRGDEMGAKLTLLCETGDVR